MDAPGWRTTHKTKWSTAILFFLIWVRGKKFHSSARYYDWNLERTSNSSQRTCPTGQVLWEKLLEEVISHITLLCSLLHTLLKDKCMYLQDEWKLLCHSSCRTSAILKYFCPLWVHINPLHSDWKIMSYNGAYKPIFPIFGEKYPVETPGYKYLDALKPICKD